MTVYFVQAGSSWAPCCILVLLAHPEVDNPAVDAVDLKAVETKVMSVEVKTSLSDSFPIQENYQKSKYFHQKGDFRP